MHFIEIGEKTYATGLWWQTSEANSSRVLKKEASLLSKTFKEEQNTSFNCFVSQAKGMKLETSQIGLGDCDLLIDQDGQITQKVMPLALAVLNASDHRTFLHKYQLDDGFWVCGVLNGVIHPDGDFFGTEDDARKVFESLWGDVFSSSDEIFEFDDIESISQLEEILAGGQSTNYIAPIKTKLSKKQIITTIGVISALFLGTASYHFVMENRKAKIRDAKMRAAQQMLAQKKPMVSPTEGFPKKWLTAPLASFFASSCRLALNDRNVVENGWQITEWACEPEGVKVAWEKLEGASFQILPKGAIFDIEKPQKVNTVDNHALQSPRRSDVPLWDIKDASAKLHDIAQAFRLRIDCDYFLEPEKRVIVDQKNPKNTQTITASFKKIAFELTGSAVFPSTQFIEMLGSIPGMVIENLSYKNNWVLRGTVYVAA